MDTDKIGRKHMGNRVRFSLAGIVTFFGTLLILAKFPTLPAAEVLNTCMVLVGMLSVSIVGDTARPGGMKKGAFGAGRKSKVDTE